jgi:hypothetical protein
MEPGSWAELETEGLLAAITQQLGVGATGSIFPYAEEGVWHAASGRFFFIGSDHIYDSSNRGQRFVAYVEDEGRWEVMPEPPFFGNGTMHGYDHMSILDGRLYHIGLIRGGPLHEYDPATETWTNRAGLDEGSYNHYGGLEPFPELGGLVYVEGGGVYLWDAAADSWRTLATGVPMGDYHNFAEYDPVHGVVLLGGGNGSGVVHVLDADENLTRAQDAPFPLRVNEAIVTVDPISGDYVVLGGDHEMWVYDPTMDEWSLQPDSLPASFARRGIADLTIAGPIDSHGVILFVKHLGIGDSGEAEVWLYKHSPGMGTGRPDGGPPPPARDAGGAGDADGGTPPRGDGSAGAGDGGVTTAAADGEGGCGCRTTAPRRPPSWPALAVLACMVVATYRRAP